MEEQPKVISVNEVRMYLHNLLVKPSFTEQDAVELYCFYTKKYGYIREDGKVVIQPRENGL